MIMRKTLIFAIMIASTIRIGLAAKYTISNVGNTFSPGTLTIEVGEDVQFNLGSSHNAVEVTKETWDANGNTPKDGGLSVSYGGGELVFNTPGTYYFVCQPHASLGMKMVIVVDGTTAINSVSDNISSFRVFPNPASNSDEVFINYILDTYSKIEIKVYSTMGREIDTILKETQSEGEHTTFWKPGKLPPGEYYIRITTESFSHTQPIVVK